MFALALAALMATHAWAQETPPVEILKADGVPVRVHLARPEKGQPGWEYRINDRADVKITISRPFNSPPIIGLGGMELYQPDFARITDEGIRALAQDSVPGSGEIPADATVTRTTHEKLGDIVTLAYTTPGLDKAPALDQRVIFLPVEAGFGFFDGTHLSGEPGLDDAMAEILGMTEVPRPAVATSEFKTGHVAAPAGYELDLPEGWRALTDSEMGLLSTDRIDYGPFKGSPTHLVFLDPAPQTGELSQARFITCAASAAAIHPTEVMPPDKSPTHAKNYVSRARVFLRKGSYTDPSGERVSLARVDIAGGAPVVIEMEEEGTLEFMTVGDRDAYFWQGKATFQDKPVRVAAFYTTWDDIGLDCGVVARDDDAELIPLFRRAVGTLRVTDGVSHPMYLSAMSRYKRWWPWTHPALQLYWLPIPLFLLGVFLAMRGD